MPLQASNDRLWCGVDPGTSGAIAVLDGHGLVETIHLDQTERDIDEWFRARARAIQMAWIEQVHAFPRQGVASTFTFGRSYGFLRGLLITHQVAFEEVSPVRWQREMQCRTRGQKNVTKARAQQLFPGLKVTHRTADALLLAEGCRRTHSLDDWF